MIKNYSVYSILLFFCAELFGMQNLFQRLWHKKNHAVGMSWLEQLPRDLMSVLIQPKSFYYEDLRKSLVTIFALNCMSKTLKKMMSHTQIVTIKNNIIDRIAHYNQVDKNGNTLLMNAISEANVQKVYELIINGAKITHSSLPTNPILSVLVFMDWQLDFTTSMTIMRLLVDAYPEIAYIIYKMSLTINLA